MALTYRLSREEDFQHVVRLWQEESDWGAFPLETFKKYFQGEPDSDPILGVAEDSDSGAIVGLAGMMPSRLSVNGREIPAYRPRGPVLAKQARGRSLNPLEHPAVQFYSLLSRTLKARGVGITYSLPDPNWQLLFRMIPGSQRGVFPLWSLPVPLSQPFVLEAGHTAGPLQAWDERVDLLWSVTSRQYPCQLVRDSRAMAFKTEESMTVIGIERNGELVGLVSSLEKGDRQWLICDLMAKDDDARRAALMAVSNFADQQAREPRPDARPVHKTAILAIPALQPALGELGFRRDEYNFYLMVRILDDSIRKEDVDPAHWYLSALD